VGVSDGRSEEWVAGFNHAMRVMALWLEFQENLPADGSCCPPGLSSTGMRKSNLLGRLMRGEEIRRRPCPTHQGRLDGLIDLTNPEAQACCDRTGWLKNDEPDSDHGLRFAPKPWWRFWRKH
jgi:hypothetical protein